MRTILVVDDSSTSRQVLTDRLQEAGYRVVYATDGVEGLVMTISERPDLVIIDLVMPSMDGFEFARHLRADPGIAHTPIIFYTGGYAEYETRPLAEACGVVHILLKGCTTEEFLRTVDLALQETKLPDPALISGENFARAHRQALTDKLAQKVRQLEETNQALIEANSELQAEIAARKQEQAEKEASGRIVLQQQQRLGDLVSSIPGVVWESFGAPDSASQHMDFVSDHVEEMIGFTRDEWLSIPGLWLTLVHPDDKERAVKEAVSIFAGKKGGASTFRWIAKDGRTLWVTSRSVVIFNEAGEPVGMRGVTVDITAQKKAEMRRLKVREALEQRVAVRTAELAEVNRKLESEITEHKRTEEELRRREESFRALSENLPDFINRLDPGFRHLYTNYYFERFEGKTLDESGFPAEVTAFWKHHIQAVIDSRRAGLMEFELLGEDGVLRLFQARLVPEFTAMGEIASVLVVSRDITEQKHAEEAIKRAQGEAERANNAKSEFLSRMSHELRTPLNAILGFAQILEMDELNPEQRDNIEQILKAGRHLLCLINEVLDIARIEAGRLEVMLEPVQVSEILGECVVLLRPLAAQRKIQIEVCSVATCGWRVLADRQRFKQVLLNLLSNAVKYNREAGRVEISFQERPEPKLRIMIADTGLGIAPSDILRLFEPFARFGAAQVDVEGSGLGLPIAKRLVELMEGAIGVESTVGEGSVFWVELPLAESSAVQPEDC